MAIKFPAHSGKKIIALVVVALVLTGCAETIGYTLIMPFIPPAEHMHDRVRGTHEPNQFSIKSNLDVGIPITAPIVIHVYEATEGKYIPIKEQPYDRSLDTPKYNSPIWHLTENSALESFRDLSINVSIDREIDKPDNLAESLPWYESKANEDPKSAFKLGLIYHLGQEVPVNYPLAKKWYLQSGVPAAKYNVVEMWKNKHEYYDTRPPEIDKLGKECWGYEYGYDTECKFETLGSLMSKIREDQELIANTINLNAYIFHISVYFCKSHASKPSWNLVQKRKEPQKTFILIKVFHVDGSDFGEYLLEDYEHERPYDQYLLKSVYVAFNIVARELVNSISFVDHYQSVYIQ